MSDLPTGIVTLRIAPWWFICLGPARQSLAEARLARDREFVDSLFWELRIQLGTGRVFPREFVDT